MDLGGADRNAFCTLRIGGGSLKLGHEEGEFFLAETGIQDPEQLRNLVNEVHEEAYREVLTNTCPQVDRESRDRREGLALPNFFRPLTSFKSNILSASGVLPVLKVSPVVIGRDYYEEALQLFATTLRHVWRGIRLSRY